MKTNRFLFALASAAIFVGSIAPSKAQVLTPEDDGIVPKSQMHYVNSKPVEYTFLRQDDIMWSTRHWERIDMREKINHPLYYPVKPQPAVLWHSCEGSQRGCWQSEHPGYRQR